MHIAAEQFGAAMKAVGVSNSQVQAVLERIIPCLKQEVETGEFHPDVVALHEALPDNIEKAVLEGLGLTEASLNDWYKGMWSAAENSKVEASKQVLAVCESLQSVLQAYPEWLEAPAPVVRKRGRPKGSKNKSKTGKRGKRGG